MGLLEEFLKKTDLEEKYERIMKAVHAFVSDYPVERISTLSLEEYYKTGKHDTFCYRLERGLARHSSMGNVFPNAFGVFIDSQGTTKVSVRLEKQFGNDYQGAFKHQKEIIQRLLESGQKEDYPAIESSEINSQFRFKLLSVYFPDKYFPVCTLPAAQAYCRIFGISIQTSETMLSINRKLVTYKNSHLPKEWSLYHAMAFADWLWRRDKKFKSGFSDFDKNEAKADGIEAEIDKLQLYGEEREAVVRQRVNQGVFRDLLLKKYDRCCLCDVRNPELLIASHIKPWVDSTPKERLDPDNGFLMCPDHDKLFDRHFITFEDDGCIRISERLTNDDRLWMGIKPEMKIKLTEGNKKYLKVHRDTFEEMNGKDKG